MAVGFAALNFILILGALVELIWLPRIAFGLNMSARGIKRWMQ